MNQKLKPEKLFEGRKKALQNAKELLEDAKILFKANRYARSFFLIQISTEELGKYGIMVTSSISAIHGSLNWKRFWKRFRDHKNKTEHLLLFEDLNWFLNEKQKELFKTKENKEYSAIQEDTKMKSLYSDFFIEEFIIPSQIINKSLCETSLNLIENRIELVSSFENEIASKFNLENLRPEDIESFYDKLNISKAIKKKEE